MKYIFFSILISLNSFLYSQSIIKAIKFDGLKKTEKSLVKKFIKTKIGDTLNVEKLEKENILLKRLPAFSSVNYSVENKNNNAYVNFTFKEALTLLPEINFWSAKDQFAYRLGFNEYNFWGRGIHLNLAYQNNGKSSYFANANIPYLINNFGIYLGFVFWKSDEPFYLNNQKFMYEYTNTSYETMLLYDYNYYNHFELGINLFYENYLALSNINSNTNSHLPQKLDQKKYSVKFNYKWNNINWNFFYLDGIIDNFYSQSVKTEGIKNLYLIFLNDFMYFKKIGEKGNWATRFRVGLGTNEDSPFSPFVLDNHVVIRGVGDRVDRGSGVLVLNTEFRYTVWENSWGAVQNVLFSDLGSWRLPGGTFNDFLDKNIIRWHIGGGIRLIYKKAFNTILRIDYGYGIDLHNEQGFVIGFGQYF